MEHVVFFPGLEGAPSFRRLSSRDEALRFVEHLRNVEGVAEVSVHALTPVPLAFRAWYRVEVPAEGAEGAPVEAAEAAPVAEAPVAEVPSVEAPAAEAPAVDAPAAEAPAAEPVPAGSVPFPTESVESVPVESVPVESVPVEAGAEPSPNGKRSLGFFAH